MPTDLYVFVLTPEMLGDELDRLCRPIGLRRQKESVDGVILFWRSCLTPLRRVVHTRVNVAIGMVGSGRLRDRVGTVPERVVPARVGDGLLSLAVGVVVDTE